MKTDKEIFDRVMREMDSGMYFPVTRFVEVKRFGSTDSLQFNCTIPSSPEGILVLKDELKRLGEFLLYADGQLNKQVKKKDNLFVEG